MTQANEITLEEIQLAGRTAMVMVTPVRVAGTRWANDEPDAPHRRAVLDGCKVGDVLELRREPDNGHDANAIAVYATSSPPGRVGFLPAPLAAAIAGDLDDGFSPIALITKLRQNLYNEWVVEVRMAEYN